MFFPRSKKEVDEEGGFTNGSFGVLALRGFEYKESCDHARSIGTCDNVVIYRLFHH